MTELAISLPINIALIGAPGTKKEAIASSFVDQSKDWFEANEGTVTWVTHGGNKIQEEEGVALGLYGDGEDHLRVFFKSFEEERLVARMGYSYVSVSNALASLAHCGVNLENVITGLATPDQEMNVQKYQVTMTQLTFLFWRSFRYTFGFYVPHSGTTIILPGQTDDSETVYNQRIDTGLQMLFQNFGLRIQPLPEGTPEERAAVMFETVKTICENGVPSGATDEEETDDSPSGDEATLTE